MPLQRTAHIENQKANMSLKVLSRQREELAARAARHDSRLGNAVNHVRREKKLIRRERGGWWDMSDRITYLDNHELQQHASSPDGKLISFYLKEPGKGRMGSVYIVFTVEGIVIMGDTCPCTNGVISVIGYDVNWFSARMSGSYLCEKFLNKQWVPEKGHAELRAAVLETRRYGSITKDAARDAVNRLSYISPSDLGSHEARDIYNDAGLVDFEIGWGYNPTDAAWLVAIQERFAATYNAMRDAERAA